MIFTELLIEICWESTVFLMRTDTTEQPSEHAFVLISNSSTHRSWEAPNSQLLAYSPHCCIFAQCLVGTGQRTCFCHWKLSGQIKLCTCYYPGENLSTGKGKLISMSSFSCADPFACLVMGVAHAGLSMLQREINKWCTLWKATKQRCHCDRHGLLISMSFQLMIRLYLLF